MIRLTASLAVTTCVSHRQVRPLRASITCTPNLGCDQFDIPEVIGKKKHMGRGEGRAMERRRQRDNRAVIVVTSGARARVKVKWGRGG